ncbi:NAD(P)H-dependent oxidoreductase subunit E [Chloroflexota bacterium]
MLRLNSEEELEVLRKQVKYTRQKAGTTIIVCGGTGCTASRSKDVIDAINKELLLQGTESGVQLRVTGCHGFCEQGPIAVIEPQNIFYCHITPDDAYDIVEKTIKNGEVIERLLYTDPVSGGKILTESEIPFYKAQDRQLLLQNREVNPCSLEDYISIGGFSALVKVLEELSPEEIIREIKVSGLRGRGGGWFPYRT